MFTVKRLPRDKFEAILKTLVPVLEETLKSEFAIIPFYLDKPDFGDVDIVVRENLDTVREKIIAKLNLQKGSYVSNDNIFSFAYQDFQIDLICTTTEYESSLAYFAYNDLGNILGRILHKMGLKYGSEGLSYPIRNPENNHIVDVLFITDDTKKIFGFLGYDWLSYEKWQSGFFNLEDLFSWVLDGNYIDVRIFDENELSATNRKRNKKRTTFNQFVEWMKTNLPKNGGYMFPHRDFRDEYWIPIIEKHFKCDIQARIQYAKNRIAKQAELNKKFNGRIVMEVTGLQGYLLGAFIEQFKQGAIFLNDSFEQYVENTDPEQIKEDIKELFSRPVSS